MSNTLNFRRFLLIAIDIALLYLSLLVTVFLGFGRLFDWPTFLEHIPPFSIIYFFWLIVFYVFDLYDFSVIRNKEVIRNRILAAGFLALGLGLSFFYLFPIFEVAPKTNLVLNILIFAFLFFLWRKLFLTLFSSRFLTRAAIVGQSRQSRELAKEIKFRPYLGYKLINLNLKQNFAGQIKEKKIDVFFVPPDLVFDSKLIKNLYECLPTKVKFLDWTQAYEIIAEKIPVSFISHVWFLENLGEGEKIFYDKFKRMLDIFLAGLMFTLSLPVFPFIILGIKLEDGGPVIYSQKRIGKNKVPFFLLKFRSMQKDAEKSTGAIWAQDEDPRTTKIGKFLRKSHLDELPQMINILKSDISLIGPRPERPEFVQKLEKKIPHYHIRHLIKPGFTGWAQIKFRYARSVMDSQEKFQYDLYYLKNRSLLLDLSILLKTFQLFFRK